MVARTHDFTSLHGSDSSRQAMSVLSIQFTVINWILYSIHILPRTSDLHQSHLDLQFPKMIFLNWMIVDKCQVDMILSEGVPIV